METYLVGTNGPVFHVRKEPFSGLEGKGRTVKEYPIETTKRSHGYSMRREGPFRRTGV